MNTEIKIAVLIPVYNDTECLHKTLESLKIEDPIFDVFLVDDGSDDAFTIPSSKFPFTIHLFRYSNNKGIEYALNYGLKQILSRGFQYVSRMDARDICLEPRLAKQLDYMDKNPEVGVLGTWINCVDTNENLLWIEKYPIDDDKIRALHYFRNSFCHPTVLIRTQAILECGMYDESFKSCEDFEFWTRIGRCWKLANLPIISLNVQINDEGISLANRKVLQRNQLRVLARNFNWIHWRAYIGILARAVVYLMPYKIAYFLKKQIRAQK